jgi:deazaflavin-dependent oxidoreductase (nitroreductase family)
LTGGVPVVLPRRLARLNRVVTNPIQRRYAWVLPPWAILVHRGRRSGRLYRTPVMAFISGRMLAVPVLYGERSDWVRNLLAAGGGEVVRGGRTFPLTDVRLLDAEQNDSELSAGARLTGRVSGRLLVGRLGPPRGGFGTGPRAG